MKHRSSITKPLSKRTQSGFFAGLYYDEGITGTKKDKRPALLQMITDCENGKIDLILTKSISRFARNTTDCLELVRKLAEMNIYIFFERENINTKDMEGELMLTILTSLGLHFFLGDGFFARGIDRNLIRVKK